MSLFVHHTVARGWVFAGVVAVTPAFAEQPSTYEATRFEFRAPAGCGSAEDFAERVARRSQRIRLITDAASSRSLLVEIRQASPRALRGTVTVVEADGATRTRHLKANSCKEAVEALSLIATVTLDPEALTGEPRSDEPPVADEPPAPPPEPAKATPPPRIPRAPAAPLYRFSFGVAGALLLEMAPEPAFGATASAAIEVNPGSLASPFWRLSLTHAQRRGIAEGAGDASFAFTLPTVDACPVRLGPRAFGVRPCAFGTVGLLRAWGEGTLRNESHSRLYGAAGVALWLGWRVSEVFEIIADGRLGIPFRRDEFAFAGSVFFKTPSPAFSLGLGAAGGFP